MKNKEIEELLNDLKSVYELNKPLTDKYKEDCMRFVINTKEAELLLSYIEQLEKEYNRSLDKLRNLRVENEQLKHNRDKAIEILYKIKHVEMENLFSGVEYSNTDKIINILGDKSD